MCVGQVQEAETCYDGASEAPSLPLCWKGRIWRRKKKSNRWVLSCITNYRAPEGFQNPGLTRGAANMNFLTQRPQPAQPTLSFQCSRMPGQETNKQANIFLTLGKSWALKHEDQRKRDASQVPFVSLSAVAMAVGLCPSTSRRVSVASIPQHGNHHLPRLWAGFKDMVFLESSRVFWWKEPSDIIFTAVLKIQCLVISGYSLCLI